MNFVAALLAIFVLQANARARRAARDRPMKIAVVGAGAIGGYVGGWLAAAGEDVTFIARGANLDAIRRERHARHRRRRHARSSRARARLEKTSDAGPQDVVVLAVKAHQVGADRGGPRGALPRRDGDRHDAERHSVVVLPQARRRVRGNAGALAPIPTARSRDSSTPIASSDPSCIPRRRSRRPASCTSSKARRFTLGEPTDRRRRARRRSRRRSRAPASRRR